jgi:Glycosyl transferase family 2
VCNHGRLSVPEMSVVLIDLHGDLGNSLRALRAQGPPEQLEVVLVTPAAEAVGRMYPELAGFNSVRLVDSGSAPTTSRAMAAGFRAAQGAIVAYCEDHVFPESGWAQARLAAHAAGAAVVGGALRNGNPETAASWAAYLQSFGPFAMPVAGGRSKDLPWHQCSYRRGALPLGPELEDLLENEGLLHSDLLKAGHQLVVESAAVAGHLNPSRLSSLLTHAWLGGRVWGAGRARHERWSGLRCALHALLFPRTALRELRARRRDAERVIPSRARSVSVLMAAAILVHAMAEAIGVMLGEGAATMRLTDLELNRRAHLAARDEGS